MSSRSVTIAPADMGQVYIPVTAASYADQLARLPASRIRSVSLGEIVADSGASHLCLPAETIDALGLEPIGDVVVSTPTGSSPTVLFGGVAITVHGRSRLVSCLRLPGGGRPLLGAIAMEELGIELDLKQRTYWLRPDDNPDSYLTA